MPILQDDVVEAPESILLLLSDPQGAIVDRTEAIAVIVDDEQSPGVVEFSWPVYRPDSDRARIHLVRSGGMTGPISVRLRVTGGTARSGLDFFAPAERVRFADGETDVALNVGIRQTLNPQGWTFVTFGLSEPTGGASLGRRDTARLEIPGHTENAGVFDISGPDLVREGEAATIRVSRGGETTGRATVDVVALERTGTVGVDYEPVGITLVFEDGDSTATFTFQTIDDEAPEGYEAVDLLLANPTGDAVIGDPLGHPLTIEDDDAASFSLIGFDFGGPPRLLRAREDSGNVSLRIHRRGDTTRPASVSYGTVDGSSSQLLDFLDARAGTDYLRVNSTVFFEAGESARTITIPILNDDEPEHEEIFSVVLLNASEGTSLDPAYSEVAITIRDDTLAELVPECAE